MRILNVNATMDPVWGGGGAERIRQLSLALCRQGHHVTVLTVGLDAASIASLQLLGLEVVVLRLLNRRFSIPAFPLRFLLSVIRDHDIIHLSGHWTILNAVIYILARIYRRPYVVSPVGTLPVFGRSRILKHLYNTLIGFSCIRNANAHISVTPKESLYFLEYGVDPSRVVVIPNGVGIEAFAIPDTQLFRRRHKLGSAPFILFMGRLNPIKGPDLLLDAFAQVADRFPLYLLVFAGPDEGMKGRLLEATLEYQLFDRVRFIGHVGGEEKVATFRSATLLVIPSRQEAMSIVVLEGGAASIPVLLTNQCGFDEVAEICGGMVVEAEANAIAEGLNCMLENPSKLSESGARLHDFVRRNFTWDVAALRLAQVFEGVVNKESVSKVNG